MSNNMFFPNHGQIENIYLAKSHGRLPVVMATLRGLAGDRTICLPDSARMPTGFLREQGGVVLMDPTEFAERRRALFEKLQAEREQREAREKLWNGVGRFTARTGKTSADHNSGAHARREANRAERDLACQARKGASGGGGGNKNKGGNGKKK